MTMGMTTDVRMPRLRNVRQNRDEKPGQTQNHNAYNCYHL